MTEAENMLECEAREWLRRVRGEVRPDGRHHTRASGEQRLAEIMADIERIRGKRAADELRAAIERLRAAIERLRAAEKVAHEA